MPHALGLWAHLDDAPGVRPSSGAAIPEQRGWHDFSTTVRNANVVAPGDGRTPRAVSRCTLGLLAREFTEAPHFGLRIGAKLRTMVRA
jgi:hypothetical protein